MGYHRKEITKGILGEFSKIKEEFDELEDAFEQEDPILQLCELTDLIGAIEHYALNKHNITLKELIMFSKKTQSYKSE
jgi:hypothetical protein